MKKTTTTTTTNTTKQFKTAEFRIAYNETALLANPEDKAHANSYVIWFIRSQELKNHENDKVAQEINRKRGENIDNPDLGLSEYEKDYIQAWEEHKDSLKELISKTGITQEMFGELPEHDQLIIKLLARISYQKTEVAYTEDVLVKTFDAIKGFWSGEKGSKKVLSAQLNYILYGLRQPGTIFNGISARVRETAVSNSNGDIAKLLALYIKGFKPNNENQLEYTTINSKQMTSFLNTFFTMYIQKLDVEKATDENRDTKLEESMEGEKA